MHDTARPVVVIETGRSQVHVVTHREAEPVRAVLDGIKQLQAAVEAHGDSVASAHDAIKIAYVGLLRTIEERVFEAKPTQQPGGHVVVDLTPWLTAPALPGPVGPDV